MKYGFEQMQLHRINVDTRMDNVASVRLMSRLAFTHEGIRRECVRSDDRSYQNWGLFGMLQQEYDPEWEEPNTVSARSYDSFPL